MKLQASEIDPIANDLKGTIAIEICNLSVVRRVAAMLDQHPDEQVDGDPLPRGWHFPLMAADTRRSLLRADGFPGLGVVMPDFGLPRLLLGSRAVSFLRDIPIGAALMRHSRLKNLVEKTTKNGPMVVATIYHELRLQQDDLLALVESQTYLLLPASKGVQTFSSDQVAADTAETADTCGYRVKTVVPDQTLLFQYSALGFNSHKIHLDRAYARDVEGFPDLVVNGGLVTLLLLKFFKDEIDEVPMAMNARHLCPLFCDHPITLVANKLGSKWQLQAYNHLSILAVEMEVQTDEL
jgi:3-methylfumaryl-CoA hydratase